MARRPRAFVANFLGKTNVLRAAAIGDAGHRSLAIGALRLPLPWRRRQENRMHRGAARAPRLRWRQAQPARSQATVRSRIFQGTHWLFEIESEAGAVDADSPQ